MWQLRTLVSPSPPAPLDLDPSHLPFTDHTHTHTRTHGAVPNDILKLRNKTHVPREQDGMAKDYGTMMGLRC